MAGDITLAVCDALITVLTRELQTEIATSDPLRARRVEKYPLQDDPTTQAPYIIVAPDVERGQIPDPEMPPEIGGGTWWVDFYQVEGRIPKQVSKNAAYTAIGTFRDRILRALITYGNLDGVTTDDSKWYIWKSGAGPDGPIARSRVRVFGGDREFYGEALFELYYRSYYTG